jgi:hypothetical protein
MIFRISSSEDSFIDKIYSESVADLNKFYELNWVHHLPKILIVPDRKTFDELNNEKTEPWNVGWAEGRTIYVLDKNSFETESSHKYSDSYYSKLIKHEFSHLFYNNLAKGSYKPKWLSEGTAVFTSGQNYGKDKPAMFSKFLQFFDKNGKDNYKESGFAVQCLIEKYGKEKLLELIKNLSSAKSEQEFYGLFEKIYGIKLSYDNFNKIL